MNEQRKDFLKILLIIILVTSVFSGNILGVCISAFGLYGLQNDNIDMIKMILIPFIIEIVIIFMLGFGIFLAIVIVLVAPIEDDDDGDAKATAMAVLIPILVIIVAFGIFQIIVAYLINKFINDIYREKDSKNNNNNNMEDNKQNIQNTNIYAESSSVPPSLPPRQPSPVQQYDQMSPQQYGQMPPQQYGQMPGYPNNYPQYNGCYPVIDQNDAPPPYVNNPNIQVSDEKH